MIALVVARVRSVAPVHPEWLALIAFGAGYRIWAGVYIGQHSNGSELSGAMLAVRGPYALSRHPLYLANLLAGTGLILFANCLPPAFAALLILLSFFHHDRLARQEEKFLENHWGDAYGDYRARTPRWLGFWKKAHGKIKNAHEQNPVTAANLGGEFIWAASSEDARGSGGRFPNRGFQGLEGALRRQGGNVLKLGVTVALLWALAVPRI